MRSLAAAALVGLGLLGGAAQAGPSMAEVREHLDQGEERTAIIRLKNLLQAEPDNGPARFLLGRTYLQLGRAEAAEKELSRARDLGVARSDWLPLLVQAHLQQGRPEAALDLLAAREDDPEDLHLQIQVLRGEVRLSQGRLGEAEAAFRRARQMQSDYVPALLGEARLALERGDIEGAGKQLARLRQQAPEKAGVWVLSGQLRLLRGEPEAAEAPFERALEIAPGNREAVLGLVVARLRVGKADAAAEALGSLGEQRGSPPRLRYLRALVVLQQEDREAARAILQELVARQEVPPAHLVLGRMAFSEGRFQIAANHLELYHQRYPRRLAPAKLLAAIYLRMGKPGKAASLLAPLRAHGGAGDAQYLALLGQARIAAGDVQAGYRDLEAAAELAPEDSRIRGRLALGYLAGGRAEAAVPELRKVIELEPEVIGARYFLVLNLLKAGKGEEAAEAARDILAREDGDPVARNLLGLALRRQGAQEEAAAEFRAVLKDHPDFHPARLNLARLHHEAGEPETARQHLREVLDRAPDNREALLAMANLAGAAGKPAEREEWLARAWEAHSPDPTVGLALARHRLGKGRSAQALQVARVLRERHPDHPMVLAVTGAAQLASGSLASAARNFEALVERRPESLEARVSLARGYLAMERPSDAREQLESALEHHPESIKALQVLAGLENEVGNTERALEVAQRLQELAPDDPVGYQLAGEANRRRGEFAAAEGAYRAALDKGPTRMAALRLTQVLDERGRTQEATAVLRRWLQHAPDDHDARAALASLLMETGDHADAAVAYERALKGQPDNASILNNLAWLRLKLGEEGAADYARRAHQLAPDRPEIADTYGWALVKDGQTQKGLRLLQEAAIHAPHIPSIRYHLAVALVRAGRNREARRELEAVVGSESEFPQREAARKLLESLRGRG